MTIDPIDLSPRATAVAALPRRAPRTALLATGLLATAALWGHAAALDYVADDAYISFRYARHLAAGHGAVFQPGARVMGYSNPLWTAVLALGEAMGLGGELLAPLLGALCGGATLALLLAWGRGHLAGRWSVAALWLLPACSGTFALWTMAGLEGPLFGLLLTAAALALHRAGPTAAPRALVPAAALLALAVWTRPEAPLLVAALALAQAARGRWAARPALTTVAAVAALPLLAWTLQAAAIWLYYGDIVPNTYYAKAHPLSWPLVARAGRLSWRFVSANAGIPLLIPLAWLGTRAWRLGGPGPLMLALLLGFCGFFASVGGDALLWHRMWAWTIPWLAVLAAEALAAAPPLRRRPAIGGLLVATTAALWLAPSLGGPARRMLDLDRQIVEAGRALGERLAALPPSTRVAANTVGALAYHADLHVIDMLGLTDAEIARSPGRRLGVPAHESHCGRCVLARQPDLIVMGVPFVRARALTAAELAATAQYPSDRDLLAQPAFARDYVAIAVAVDASGAGGSTDSVSLWARRAWLASGGAAFARSEPATRPHPAQSAR